MYHDHSCFPEVNRRIGLPYVAMGVSLTVQVCDFQAHEVAVKKPSWFSVFSYYPLSAAVSAVAVRVS